MNILKLRKQERGIPGSGLGLLLDARSIAFYIDGEKTFFKQLSHASGTKFGSIECLLFFLQVLQKYESIRELELEDLELGFIATYARLELDIPYIVSGVETLPASLWHLVFNSKGVINSAKLLKKLYLPEGYPQAKECKQTKITTDEKELRVRALIVAYYSEPFDAVGSKRPEFMNNYFNSKEGVTSSIVSAVNSAKPNHQMVPDPGVVSMNPIEDMDVLSLYKERVSIIGASWVKPLTKALDQQLTVKENKPNVIIFTGNPFYYFGVANYIKNKYGILTVLDYRDPFANNPLMLRSLKVKTVQKKLESYYNSNADIICVVNSKCLELIEGPVSNKRTLIIENGFDESLYKERSKISTEGALTFVYAGSFGAFRSGEVFLEALSGFEHKMNYVGGDEKFGIEYDFVQRLGHRPISETSKIISEADVGVVFATGETFESTTKIYDYIGAGLPILIVTNGEPRTGAIHELTKNLNEIYWVLNSKSEIKNFLESYIPANPNRAEVDRYSRGFQTNLLLNCIEGCLSGN